MQKMKTQRIQFHFFAIIDALVFIAFIILFAIGFLTTKYKSAFIVVFYFLNIFMYIMVQLEDGVWGRTWYFYCTLLKVLFAGINLPIFIVNLDTQELIMQVCTKYFNIPESEYLLDNTGVKDLGSFTN
jgi:hypothetical protein